MIARNRPVLVFPDPAPVDVTTALDLAGHSWKSLANPSAARRIEAMEPFSAAIVSTLPDIEGAFAVCSALRSQETPFRPILLVIGARHIHHLHRREELFDDFCVAPWAGDELELRLNTLMWRHDEHLPSSDEIEHGPLHLNLDTYQAVIAGRPLDLTYMEYELLKYLVSSPGKVFTREVLLREVWGYEYFGGARTVDVHVRRLRAKLGEEHANLIQTVRSVGYRFGITRYPDNG